MGKDKLRRFRENLTFECFVQPEFDEVFHRDHPLKGNWNRDFFRNRKPTLCILRSVAVFAPRHMRAPLMSMPM